MAGTEVKVSLGLDTGPFAKALSKTKAEFSRFGSEAGQVLDRKLGGKDAFKSFVVAAGLGIDTVADAFARLWTGVSKEAEKAYEDMVAASDKATTQVLANINRNATDQQKLIKLGAEQAKIIDQLQNETPTETNVIGGRTGEFSAEQLKDRAEKSARLADIQKEQADILEKQGKESKTTADELEKKQKELNDLQKDHANIGEADAAKQKRLKDEAWEITQLAKINGLDGVKLADAQIEAQKKENEAAEVGLKIEKDKVELAKKRKAIIGEITDKQQEIAKQEANLQEEKDDRGKLTLKEIASVGQFQAGVSQDVANQGQQARDFFDLKRRSEEKRMTGDVKGANELMGQADTIRTSLTEGGNVKKSEDPFRPVTDAIKDNKKELEKLNIKLATVVGD